MDFFDAVHARFSYRGRFDSKPVPRGDLTRIMEAGLAAPSGCNCQTTRLIAVDDPQLLGKLGAILKKPNFASAPAAICVIAEPKVAYEGATFYVQDYSAAIENILLAVTALGYASCWVEGYVRNYVCEEMSQALGVKPPYELIAFLPIGLPLEEGTRAKKLPSEKRISWNGF